MSNYTPGPWKRVGSYIDAIENRKERIIAKTVVLDMPNLEKQEHEHLLAEANARLIAAAPDLLEACRKLWLTTAMIPVDWKNPEAKELSQKALDAMDEAKTAMDKAEGKQS